MLSGPKKPYAKPELRRHGELMKLAEAPEWGPLHWEPQQMEAAEKEAVAGLWRKTVSEVPSLFGRLVYTASLEDHDSCVHKHYGLALVLGGEEADRVIRGSRRESFSQWLSLSLEQQKADLELYFSDFPGNRRQILETWTVVAPYRTLAPPGTPEVERQLYQADMEAILDLFKNEYAGLAAANELRKLVPKPSFPS